MKTVMGIVTALVVLGAAFVFACSSSGEEGEQSEVAPPLLSASTNNPQPVGLAPVFYYGEESIEERIVNADTIVVARLIRTTNEAVTGSGGPFDGKYFPALKFHLTVKEYLKGASANNITALWIRRDPYNTQLEAETVAPEFTDGRDTTWDGRDAILFLTKKADLATRGDDFFSEKVQAADDYITMGFRLDDRYRKLWLPHTGTAATGDSQEFLLAVPEPGVTTPTITLGELKSRMATINAEWNAGDGSDAYRECVSNKYTSIRMEQARLSQGDTRRSFDPGWDGAFVSGQPAGTELYEYDYGFVETVDGAEKKTNLRIDGKDAALLSVTEGARRPGFREDQMRFIYSVVSTRPIPAGTYRFNHHYDGYIVCGNTSTFEMTANVKAPEGVLHELFFDPVTVGTAVGANATNGVLKPAAFTDSNGESATIERIAWEPGAGESGTVKLHIDPHTGVAGQVLDFIELDGSVSLSLDVGEATVDAANDTLSWTVASQPWEDGDLLMVRIREG